MMNSLSRKTLFVFLCSALAFGCGDDDMVTPDASVDDTGTSDTGDTGTEDTGTEDTGTEDAGPPPDPTCENLCTTTLAACDGEAAAYANMSECMTWCETVGAWEAGTAGDTDGNTIACRISAAAAGNCAAAGFTGGNVCGTYCDNYCGNIGRTCEGSDAVYDNEAACRTACGEFNDDGVAGDTGGDSVQCRIYHAGLPADAMPMTHCPHASPEGAGICVFDAMGFDFRTDAPDAYTRVDRLGMPAVSTALVTNKAAYNDGTPQDDANLMFAVEILGNLGALHTALDDDIADTAGITACSMDPSDPDDASSLPVCVAQTVGAGGPSVVSLVVPDTLSLDTSAAAGFPNGRRLADPVMDVTLAVILLDLTMNGPTDLVGVLNPEANDVEFNTEFPYLADAN